MAIPQFIYKGFFGGDENLLEFSTDSGDHCKLWIH